MRRLVHVLLVALVAVSCANATESGEEAQADGADPVASDPVPTGRAALTAAQGEPHVLWFWGAH